VAEHITSEEFAFGQTIFTQGEPGHVAYVVRKGNVAISTMLNSVSTPIATRGPGEIIGEMALVSGARRSATAKAATDCVLTALPRAEVDRRMDEADPILKIILLTAFERLREAAARSDNYLSPEKP
jgi:diguanylate cyclase